MNARSHSPREFGFLQCAAVAACLLLASCGGSSGSWDASSAASATPGSPVIVSIGASPTALTVGESVTLTWSSSNATGCLASGDWSGAQGLSGTQLVTPSAAGTFTYTLTCSGVAGSASVAVANLPTPIPTVSISLAPTSVPTGQQSTLTWSTTNAASCSASLAWTGNRDTSGSIAVAQPVAGSYTYSLSCIGPGGSASGSVTLVATGAASNVAEVVIDSGPGGISGINVPYVSVTVCRPGTSTCQTIDHVMVDTGSFGLRIVAGVLNTTALALPAVNGPGGNPVGECAPFVSGFLWGSVHRADVKIAGETALSLPIQQVGDTGAAFTRIPTACSNSGRRTNLGTVGALRANGILGVGLFDQDCGSGCTTQVANGFYYECTTTVCNGIVMPLANQVANPVPKFAADNNGVALVMPAVAVGGATTVTGALIFGIDTQANNNVGIATVYAVDSGGNFITTYKSASLASSFLDTGSNGLFFSDAAIPRCSASSTGFYCPPTTLPLSAVNTSANGVSGTVNFRIENLQALDATVRAASVGGSLGRSNNNTFDWGMPFFFGRTVFVAIEGQTTLHGKGPYWAY